MWDLYEVHYEVLNYFGVVFVISLKHCFLSIFGG